MAREIHDHLGAELTALRYALARIASEIASQTPACMAALADAEAALEAAVAASRTIVDTRRSIDAPRDLATQLQNWITVFGRHVGLPIHFDFRAKPWRGPIDTDTSLAVLRITQEALNNVAKHANAQHAAVRLSVLRHGLRLIIRDDGRGIVGRHADRVGSSAGGGRDARVAGDGRDGSGAGTHGNGLRTIFERCEALGGSCTLHRPLGGGLELRIRLMGHGHRDSAPT